jgi:hypothetical protein
MPREPSSRESKVVESSFLRVSLPPGVHFTVGFEKIARGAITSRGAGMAR